MQRIAVGDINLNVEQRGRGAPLLLVHGFPLDHSMWRHQLDAFGARFHVIAPDLRGFGQSDATPPGTVTMAQLADDLAGLLDALGITQPVTFCALSMGGYVAFPFVCRHAKRLDKLILCDTRAVADTAEAAQNRRAFADRVLAEGSAVAADAMLPKLFAPLTAEKQPEVVEQTRQVMLRANPIGVAAALEAMAVREDSTGLLPTIQVPALLLCGEHDGISTPDEMRGMAQAIPAARFEEIPGAGHMAPLEAPGPVNRAIAQFLGVTTA
jgi:pimeloyl-ACP methyl ester carboxylesterase